MNLFLYRQKKSFIAHNLIIIAELSTLVSFVTQVLCIPPPPQLSCEPDLEC